MKQRLASPEKPWADITPQHKSLRKSVEDIIESIDENEPSEFDYDPLAVVGPYRAGKTQLLYHSFHCAWNNGIPALYTDAQSIFDEFEASDANTISEWLSDRVTSQIESLLDGDSADWLPNWDSSELEEDFIADVGELESVDTSRVVLLVDEIEQAYTHLRSNDLVDDENPLRVLLDDTQGVYQIWAFGLVSAYEFLGEADYARFEEVRLPLLTVDDVRQRLDDQDKTTEIANGIWWLARGRIGWINKLVEEAPASEEGLSDWISSLGTLNFDGLTPINKEVWTESTVDKNRWDQARRASLFLQGEYEDWQVRGRSGESMTVSDAAGLSLDIILNETSMSLSPDSKEIIERNLKRLCDALSPITESNSESRYLPANLITDRAQANGYLDLLEDLILSFEARGERRAKAIGAIEDIDNDTFRVGWTDRYHNYLADYDGAWSIKPSIVAEAYPAVGVDPTNLSDSTHKRIEADITSGIQIKGETSRLNCFCEVYFCPNESSLNTVIDLAESSKKLTTTYVVVTPESPSDLGVDPQSIEAVGLKRLTFHEESAERLWDFVVHLYHYVTVENNVSLPITNRKISEIIDDEENREKRNTVQSLYEQIENIANTAQSEAFDNFVEYYSRDGKNQPIWGDDHLDDDSPPGMYGAGSSARQGLDYSLICSARGLSAEDEFVDLPDVMLEGIDEGYIDVEGQKFGFENFLQYVFTDGLLSSPVQNVRELYIDESVGRDTAVDHLQDYLLEMTEEENLLQRLTDMDSEVGDFDVLSGTSFENQLAPQFLWGVLLDAVAQESEEQVANYVGEIISREQSLIDDLAQISNRITNRNSQLSSHDGMGRGVEIRSDTLSEYEEHIQLVLDLTEVLSDRLDNEPRLSTIAVVYRTVLDSYLHGFDEEVDFIKGTIYDSNLLELKKLEGQYNRFESNLKDLSEHTVYLQKSEDEVEQILRNVGNAVFDFQRPIGDESIAPSDEESFEALIGWAEENSSRLSEYNDQMEKIESLLDERETEQENCTEAFSEFYQTVMTGGGDN